MLVTPDETVTSRGRDQAAPRPNVLWEHGFFTGGLGRNRVFLVRPRGADLKLPSDLLGITALEYNPQGSPHDLRARLGPVVSGIRKQVEEIRVR